MASTSLAVVLNSMKRGESESLSLLAVGRDVDGFSA